MTQDITLTGKVIKKLVAQGSKSEREAVVLVTDKNEYVLRQHGGNPYKDSVLDDMVGKRVKGEGKILGYTFILNDWEELD